MDNKIIIFDENQNEEIVSQIKGLNITFKGKMNIVRIEKGSIFRSCHLILSNNCEVIIKKSHSIGIRRLSVWLFDKCKINIGKDFSCVSLDIYLTDEKNSSVIIGDYCMCAQYVRIRPSDGHILYDINTEELLNKGEGIVIGNHVWIGVNSLFLKGAKVSDNTIIGANSLVNKKFDEKNVIIAGSPAKIVKRDVNWDRRSPERYDEFIEVKRKERDKFSVDDDLVFKERKSNKLWSFVYISKKENLNPKNIYKIFKAKRQIRSSNLFDEKYYLTKYPHIKNSNMNPLDHYIYHGWVEKKSPSKKFDGNYYLRKYSDVNKSNINPLVHYVLYGKNEGRFPNHQAELIHHKIK